MEAQLIGNTGGISVNTSDNGFQTANIATLKSDFASLREMLYSFDADIYSLELTVEALLEIEIEDFVDAVRVNQADQLVAL
jgi:hypothetical protein